MGLNCILSDKLQLVFLVRSLHLEKTRIAEENSGRSVREGTELDNNVVIGRSL
jgi:hypothetical protein